MSNIRFTVGDKSQGVEITSISADQYHMVCSCDRPFSRGFTMEHIPVSCRACADDRRREFVGKPLQTGMVLREYTDEENAMIKGFQDG